MKQFTTGPAVPEAHICINKSQLKIYNKETDPTFYLKDGQEFQILLFNPTQDTVLAKIYLNNKAISQGGLVLKPGQRVFLERYLDVAKKFLFETYEVSNTAQVREAIKNNGDFKVEFFRESKPFYNPTITTTTTVYPPIQYPWYQPHIFRFNNPMTGDRLSGNLYNANDFNQQDLSDSIRGTSNTAFYNSSSLLDVNQVFSSSVTLDAMEDIKSVMKSRAKLASAKPNTKSIETGRVEQGGDSNQQLTYVDKNFDYYAFHTIEYKMLPVSQKINTVGDISVAQYCSECGFKQKKGNEFCPHCGTKI